MAGQRLNNCGTLMTCRLEPHSQPNTQAVVIGYSCKGGSLLFREKTDDEHTIADCGDFNADFTVGFWFKLRDWNEQYDAKRYLISQSPATTPGWGIHVTRDAGGGFRLAYRIFSSGGVMTGNLIDPLRVGLRYCVIFESIESGGDVINTWFVGDGGGNTIVDTTATFSAVTLAGEDAGEDVWLGRAEADTDSLPALVDEVRIWTAGVVAAQKVAFFNGGAGNNDERLASGDILHGHHCDIVSTDFSGNLHPLVAGATGTFSYQSLIYQPGCDYHAAL